MLVVPSRPLPYPLSGGNILCWNERCFRIKLSKADAVSTSIWIHSCLRRDSLTACTPSSCGIDVYRAFTTIVTKNSSSCNYPISLTILKAFATIEYQNFAALYRSSMSMTLYFRNFSNTVLSVVFFYLALYFHSLSWADRSDNLL